MLILALYEDFRIAMDCFVEEWSPLYRGQMEVFTKSTYHYGSWVMRTHKASRYSKKDLIVLFTNAASKIKSYRLKICEDMILSTSKNSRHRVP